jgi:threonine synthase
MPWDKRIEPFLDRYPALRAIGGTPLVPVNVFGDELPEVEVWAKMECLNPGGSLKDRPVLRMLLTALADGRLQPGKTILDSSSGNAGIAYAMVGRIIGSPVEIVIPDNASAERKKRMLAHGAQLVYTDALKGYDEALREVHRRSETDTQRYFFCDNGRRDPRADGQPAHARHRRGRHGGHGDGPGETVEGVRLEHPHDLCAPGDVPRDRGPQTARESPGYRSRDSRRRRHR